MSNKIRVEAEMPRVKTPFYSRLSVIVSVSLVLSFAATIYWHVSTSLLPAGVAQPMKGICKDIPMKAYVGDGDKDGKVCIWRDTSYWCAYDPNKSLWGCTEMERK